METYLRFFTLWLVWNIGYVCLNKYPKSFLELSVSDQESLQNTMSLQLNVRFLRNSAAELYGSGVDMNGACGLAYATPCSAGLDLRACFEEEEIIIPAGGRYAIPAGIAIDPQCNTVAGFIYSRSGLGTKKGLTVSQGVGVVDPDYRGEIFISLLNTSGEDRVIARGERVAQLVFQPFFRAQISVVDSLEDTERGEGGFGHTGTM